MFDVQQKIKFLSRKDKVLEGYKYIAGCDEVGRGCLAGPVVAAVVVIDKSKLQGEWSSEVKDSKKLSAKKRERLSTIIKEQAAFWKIAEVSAKEIDAQNIHKASLKAMHMAVSEMLHETQVPLHNFYLYIDGKFEVPNLLCKQEAVVGGDAKIFSVACASIIAKVYRDDLITNLGEKYPEYNLAKHKGYGTKEHVAQIKKYGLSPIHRVSFCGNII